MKAKREKKNKIERTNKQTTKYIGSMNSRDNFHEFWFSSCVSLSLCSCLYLFCEVLFLASMRSKCVLSTLVTSHLFHSRQRKNIICLLLSSHHHFATSFLACGVVDVAVIPIISGFSSNCSLSMCVYDRCALYRNGIAVDCLPWNIRWNWMAEVLWLV